MKPDASRGIDRVLRRAAEEPDFAAALLKDRRSALGDLAHLSDCERRILETIDGRRLEQMIRQAHGQATRPLTA